MIIDLHEDTYIAVCTLPQREYVVEFQAPVNASKTQLRRLASFAMECETGSPAVTFWERLTLKGMKP